MQHRQGTVEMFSTFIQFDVDRFNGWITDPQLRRSMKICLEKSPAQQSDNFWILYWYKVWSKESQTNQTAILPRSRYAMLPRGAAQSAIAHISAYLQEVCYWSVRKFAINFSGHSSLADYFQIAIARLPKVLKGFNPEYSSHLKSYAELAFERIIKDELRVSREVYICSDWALLHKTSRKRLIKSLENMGLNSQTIETYVLAWECFGELYTSGNTAIRQLKKPDTATWENITNLYNSDRTSRLSFSTPAINPQMMEKWLLTCAQAVRNFLYPQVVSADAPLQDDGDVSLLDMVSADEQASLLTEMIQEEEKASFRNQQTQLNQVLDRAITALDAESQQLLQVYYLQQLTQTEIANQLGIKQYQISRRLSKVKKSLLLSLSEWSQTQLHISLTSDVIAAINTSLEEWLKFHYSQKTRQAKN